MKHTNEKRSKLNDRLQVGFDLEVKELLECVKTITCRTETRFKEYSKAMSEISKA